MIILVNSIKRGFVRDLKSSKHLEIIIFVLEFGEVFVLLVGQKWPEHKKAHEDLLDKKKLHLVYG